MIYGKLPVTFLSAIASEKQGSTNGAIAAAILKDLPEMRELGISDMARACHVSAASLSRFCKEIGLRDFTELRELLASGGQQFQRQPDSRACAQSAAESILKTERSIDAGKLKALCREIQRYEKVAVFGLLKAGAAAISLQGDLLMLGKQAYTNVSYPQQLQYISAAGKDALVLIFSYTGSYFDYPEVPPLRKNGPRIWMISGEDREYPKYVGDVLRFDSLHDQAGHPYQLLFAAELIAQEYARLGADESTYGFSRPI